MVFAPSSIGYYLHYSVTFHFIERKSIIHCTNVDGCFQASMIRRGEDGGWSTVHIVVSGCHTIRLWGVNREKKKRKRSLSNTHMHTDCILIILFPVWMSFFLCRNLCLKEVTAQFKTNPKSSESSYSHSANVCVCVFHVTAAEYCKVCLFWLKVRFQMHHQLSGINPIIIGVG